MVGQRRFANSSPVARRATNTNAAASDHHRSAKRAVCQRARVLLVVATQTSSRCRAHLAHASARRRRLTRRSQSRITAPRTLARSSRSACRQCTVAARLSRIVAAWRACTTARHWRHIAASTPPNHRAATRSSVRRVRRRRERASSARCTRSSSMARAASLARAHSLCAAYHTCAARRMRRVRASASSCRRHSSAAPASRSRARSHRAAATLWCTAAAMWRRSHALARPTRAEAANAQRDVAERRRLISRQRPPKPCRRRARADHSASTPKASYNRRCRGGRGACGTQLSSSSTPHKRSLEKASQRRASAAKAANSTTHGRGCDGTVAFVRESCDMRRTNHDGLDAPAAQQNAQHPLERSVLGCGCKQPGWNDRATRRLGTPIPKGESERQHAAVGVESKRVQGRSAQARNTADALNAHEPHGRPALACGDRWVHHAGSFVRLFLEHAGFGASAEDEGMVLAGALIGGQLQLGTDRREQPLVATSRAALRRQWRQEEDKNAPMRVGDHRVAPATAHRHPHGQPTGDSGRAEEGW
eukprot:scaffold46236_cov26-Tisochrysis_lutea.AAC.3